MKPKVNFSLSGIADAKDMLSGFASAARRAKWSEEDIKNILNEGEYLIRTKNSWMVIGLIAEHCEKPF